MKDNRHVYIDTPYGKLKLANKNKNVAKKIAIQIQKTTDTLTRKDIGDWRRAWQLAIDKERPNRQFLYDIYNDVNADLHLAGCVRQRTGFVMARSFKIVDDKGNEKEDEKKLFDTVWFKKLIKYALQSIYWGHSLIELGNVITDQKGMITFDNVTLVPRKHVIPEYHRVVRQTNQEWQTGIDYTQPGISKYIIEVGEPDELGLFLNAAIQTIPKKNAFAFWDTFAEIFGMPMRIARTTTRDEKERKKIEQMLQDSGLAGYMLADQGTELEFVEQSKNDAYNVYDKRITQANAELSKLILGQTMTIEDGSSLSQSETHLKVLQNIIEADCDMIRDVINNQLIPKMITLGFKQLKQCSFEWDYSIDYTPEQQLAYEELVLNNYEVDPAYFAEKYNMPVGERRQIIPSLTPPEENNNNKQQNNSGHFFADAPHDGAALDW